MGKIFVVAPESTAQIERALVLDLLPVSANGPGLKPDSCVALIP